MNIISWNVNGLRAVIKKGSLEELVKQNKDTDVFCFQEGKVELPQLEGILYPKKTEFENGQQVEIAGQTFYFYLNSSDSTKGHSGTILLSKTLPQKVVFGLPPYQCNFDEQIIFESEAQDLCDTEGRTITAHFKNVIIVNTYTPNGGERKGKENALEFKLHYYTAMREYLVSLKSQNKNVVMLGDINVTHKPIDLARPDANKNHVGCLPIEREQLDLFEESGFIDSWRVLHPEEQSYTWWDVITRSRERNVGWRIDAAWMTKELFKKVAGVEHLNDQMGSDHCPIKVSINKL